MTSMKLLLAAALMAVVPNPNTAVAAASLLRQRQLEETPAPEIITTPCYCACDMPGSLEEATGIAMIALDETLVGADGSTTICVSFDNSIVYFETKVADCNDFCLYTDDDSEVLAEDEVGEDEDED